MEILKFDQFNESSKPIVIETEITPAMKKSLDLLGVGLDSVDDVLWAIDFLGVKRIKEKSRTADYVFRDPKREDLKYVSYTTSYVRSISTRMRMIPRQVKSYMTPVANMMIRDPKYRLLLLLRIFMKNHDLYNNWKKSKTTIKEFLNNNRGRIKANRYGL